MENIGKQIIIIGIFLILLGFLIIFGNKFGLGKLPGDIFIKKGNFSFYFPITTSILLSLIISLITFIIFKFK